MIEERDIVISPAGFGAARLEIVDESDYTIPANPSYHLTQPHTVHQILGRGTATPNWGCSFVEWEIRWERVIVSDDGRDGEVYSSGTIHTANNPTGCDPQTPQLSSWAQIGDYFAGYESNYALFHRTVAVTAIFSGSPRVGIIHNSSNELIYDIDTGKLMHYETVT